MGISGIVDNTNISQRMNDERQWQDDLVRRQRNIVFPDIVENESRFWRGILRGEIRLNAFQKIGAVIVLLLAVGIWGNVLLKMVTEQDGGRPLWARVLAALRVVLVFWVCFSYAAKAQSSPGVFRMERVQRGEAVCVLVQGDGSYRLEKLFRAKTEMYTGTMDSARIERLRTMLADEQLRRLSQEDIHNPLISDTVDHVQFDVWRDKGWQELRFSAPASRKPFKESLDPLLRWFQDLQKRPPDSVRVEGSPTRCQPLPVTELVTTAETFVAPKPAVGAGNSAQYLFRAYSHHFYRGSVDSTCTIVFGDGSYRREHSNQSGLGARKDKVADGQLEIEAIQKLKVLLGSPELEGSPSIRDVGDSRPAQEGTTTVVSIPRQGEVQNLIFATTFNAVNNSREIGGLSNLQNHVANPKLLEPLSGWMKIYTDQRDNAVERETAGNNCAAVRAAAPSKRSPE